jgi:hypothetical protein
MLRIPCPAVNLPESCRFERYASVANGEAYLTKSNIWTLFGAPVLYHMGGSVVSCTRYSRQEMGLYSRRVRYQYMGVLLRAAKSVRRFNSY